MRLLAALLLFLGCASLGIAAKILAYFPIAAPSHHFFFQPVLHGLAGRGHHIDYFTPVPLRTPHENITVFPLENYMASRITEVPLFELWKLPIQTQIEIIWSSYFPLEARLCKTKPVQDLVASNSKYDLYIHEGSYVFETSVVFQHKFNVPSVALLAVGDFYQVNECAGLVNNPSYMVNAISEHSDTMGFLDRLHNSYLLVRGLYFQYNYLRVLQGIVDDCFKYPGWESRPSLWELLSNQSLILVNSHVSIGYPYPKPPNMKEIGGAVVQPRKPVSEDLDRFINEAQNGVIFFSLGSLFAWNKAEPGLKETFAEVFSRRKERVLWRWNGDAWDGISANVRLSHWFPQQDILAHKNVKVFISHAGLQSYVEAVNFGMPLIAVPTFADQSRNALAITRLGYGVYLKLNNITQDSLNWALDETIYKNKYKEKAIKGSAVLRDKPMDPVDEGVYWIEYVLRHGNVLQAHGSRLNFIQLHLLDVYIFILTVLLVIAYATIRLLSVLVNLFVPKKAREVGSKKLQ